MSLRTRLIGAAAITLAAVLLLGRPAAQSFGAGGPEALGIAVTDVRQDSARVSGAVAPGGKDATWWLEYGTTTAYGRRTAVTPAKGDDPIYFSVVLSGLAAGTTHHVRLVAEGGAARSTTGGATFTTSKPPAAQPADPGAAPAPDPDGAPAPADPSDPAPTTDPGSPTPPVLAKSVVVATRNGSVGVRVPGTDSFVPLGRAESIPVGSVIDATEGSIVLSAALDAAGHSQHGRFGGGRFAVRQRAGAGGYVDLHLRGADFSRCGTDRGVLARTAAKRPKRKLWGRDRNARFRTHGRDSVATVRGTRWSVTDTCAGTRTVVTEGAVDVKVRSTSRVVRVSAGDQHFARHRG